MEVDSLAGAGGWVGPGASVALVRGGAGEGSLGGVAARAGGCPRCRVVRPRVGAELTGEEGDSTAGGEAGADLGSSTGGAGAGAGRASDPRMRNLPEGATTSLSPSSGAAVGSSGSGCFGAWPARLSVGRAWRGGRRPRGGAGRGPGTDLRGVGAGGRGGVHASASSLAQGFSGMVSGSGSAESTAPVVGFGLGRRPGTTRLPLMMPVKFASRPCTSGPLVTPVGRRVTV